jgi:hypothetical protein
MDYFQSLVARNPSDNAQVMSSNGLIVQPRLQLRFEEKSFEENYPGSSQESKPGALGELFNTPPFKPQHEPLHIKSNELATNLWPQKPSSPDLNRYSPALKRYSLEPNIKSPEPNQYSSEVRKYNSGLNTNSLEKTQEPYSHSSVDESLVTPFINGTKRVKSASEEKQPQLIVEHALNQRIQTVLQSLSTHTYKNTNIATDEQSNLGKSSQLAGRRVSSILGKSDDLPQAVSDQQTVTGELQTPEWLAELRSGLQQRWKASHQQANVEPVINVTIGRVDVRAVTDNVPPHVNTEKKPVSTMTLESYLEQRDSRRQE